MAKILIVDDRPVNRELLLTLLGYAGHELWEASNGEEGLDLARAQQPDLIIADIVMPTLDGYEFARQVRDDPALNHTEIIFYTASYTEGATRQMAEACGVSYVLTKPAEPQLILDTVEEALKSHPIQPMQAVDDDFQRDHLRLLTDELAKKVEALELEVEERKRMEAVLLAKDEELRTATQELWESAKLATMGKLAAEIAHELNNPLTGIRLRIEVLLMDTPPDDPRRRDLDVINYASQEMIALVSNLLQTSRRSRPDKAAIEIGDDIDKTLELLEYHLISHRVQTIKEYAPQLPRVLADRQQMRQVFLNLLTNACDSMPEGGTLTVRAQASHTATSNSTPEKVVIEIADTGEGIPPEVSAKVWESFFTTKGEGKGTGLGLAICRRIMDEHGGSIDIQSEGIAGKGTTVRLTLPVAYGADKL